LARAGTAVAKESTTAKLARFFPTATPVRIPVRLTRMDGKQEHKFENTVIEFGTAQEVLFASRLPLEFADLLELQNSDGSLNAQACVVAVQYNAGHTAVAARFTQQVANWIVKS
jgi:hypothetical protein